MRTYRILAILLILLALLSGCSQNSADQGYKNIGPKELQQMVQNDGKNLFLLDVREPYELEETGYIPGAVNIPTGQVAEKISDLPKDKKLVIYCRSGRRSAEAAKFLSGKGYGNVYNLEGGILDWPYEKGKIK
ncbi:MAG: rhodanese-like domain-containing protein [Bacillota bacterium]